MPRLPLLAVMVVGCAVDPSGIPGENGDGGVGDAAIDQFVPDGPITPDLGRDLGSDLGIDVDMTVADLGLDQGPPDLGPPDLGPPDLGPPDLGPPDLGPPDLGPPDLGPPDLGPPDMFVPDGGCGMAEICNGTDDDCDGAIDENPGGPRGENICDGCTRAVSPGGVTYQLCPFTVEWGEALGLCQAFGYELASPETMAEDSFLDSQVFAGDDWWIGLNDRDSGGTYEWEDSAGDRPLGAFNDWDSGEPNGGFGDDCARIELDTLRWRDSDCGGTFQAENYYICEAP